MKNDIKDIKNFGDLVLLYYRYKDTPIFSYSVIGVIFFFSILLLVKVIFPQMSNWTSLNTEVAAKNDEIKTLQANTLAVSNSADSTLNEQFALASAALPYEKDFTGILNAINAASSHAGIVLDDYSFQVGDLSTKSAKLAQQTSMSLKLSIKGDIDHVEDFIKEIQEKLPLSEVVTTNFSLDGSALEVLFYYKIVPGKTQVTYTQPLPSISGDKATLLQTLKKWQDSTGTPVTQTPDQVSSGSAEPF